MQSLFQPRTSRDFKKQVLELPQSIRPKLTQVMTDLSSAYNPNILGNKKRTKYGECYTIRISDSHSVCG